MMSPAAIAAQIALASLAMAPAARRGMRPIVPRLTTAIVLLLILCAIAQHRDPALLPAVERTVAAAHGEPWRLFTALWFQDGGVEGGLLNLVMLAAVGWRAEATLTGPAWITAYLGGGLSAGLAGLIWQPQGSGNSIATLGLAGALLAAEAGGRTGAQRLRAAAGLAIAVALAFAHDIHGVAAIAGGACSMLGMVWAGQRWDDDRLTEA